MATVDKLVQDSIAAYPQIFPSRWAVLHHVLCVIGNGYSWAEDGTIESNSALEPWRREIERERYIQDFGNSDITENLFERSAARSEEVLSSIQERAQLLERPTVANFYPQSSFALLLNVPATVSDDWAEAVSFFKNEALEHGWVI